MGAQLDLETVAFGRDDGTVPDPDALSIAGLGLGQDSYLHQYWRKPDGWVTIAPEWATEYRNYALQGFTPLPRYGMFLMNANPDGWRPSVEPWRRIFQKGGAREFPVQQVLEYGWHRRAPYRGVTFPQLAGVETHDAKCPHCGRVFLTDAHMAQHESVMHTEVAQQNAVGRALAKAQVENPANLAMIEALTAIAHQLGEHAKVQSQHGEVIARLLETLNAGRSAESAEKPSKK